MPPRKADGKTRLVRKVVLLTAEMWAHLAKDARAEARSVPYVMRRLIGDAYAIPPERQNPARAEVPEEELTL